MKRAIMGLSLLHRRARRVPCHGQTTLITRGLSTTTFPPLFIVDKHVDENQREKFNKWQSRGEDLLDGVVGRDNYAVKWIKAGSNARGGGEDHPLGTMPARNFDTVLVTFQSEDLLIKWRESSVLKTWLLEGKNLQKHTHEPIEIRPSLELWGAGATEEKPESSARSKGVQQSKQTEEGGSSGPPAKWRIAATVLLALYPTIQAVSHMGIPALAAAAAAQIVPEAMVPAATQWGIVCVTVPLMVGISMPLATKLLSPSFLSPPPESAAWRTAATVPLLLCGYVGSIAAAAAL